jgi:hypothetical protein
MEEIKAGHNQNSRAECGCKCNAQLGDDAATGQENARQVGNEEPNCACSCRPEDSESTGEEAARKPPPTQV